MVNESNKIIVKVGKKSRVRFANSKVYRAITANDLSVLTTKHDDCQIVIIENISEDEQDAVRDFARDFKEKREGNTVLFYIPDSEDEITSGVADELDYNIYLTDSDLYKYIYDTFGINVSVYLADRKRLNSQELSESIPEGITDIFGSIGEDANNDIASTIAAIDEADSKGISEQLGIDDNTSGEIIDEPKETVVLTKVSEDKTEEIESASDIFGTDNIGNGDVNTDGSLEETSGEDKSNTVVSSEHKKDAVVSVEEETNTDGDIEAKHLEVFSETIPADTAEYIEELKMQIRDAKYDYSEAVKDMREANTRIASLEDIIRLLREEKDAMEKRFNELMISDEVLEDPISLAEYSVIKENADSLENQVLELNSTISSLKETIEAKELDINSAETSIEELKATIENLKGQLTAVRESIESGEAFKEQVDEYEEKLKHASEEKDKIASRLVVVEEDNEKLQGNVTELTLRADEEANVRIRTFELLKATIIKIKELNDKLTSIETEKSELLSKLETTESQLQNSKETVRGHLDTIAKLEKSVNDNDKKMELANNSSASEISQLRDRIGQLEAKLSVTEQQLEQKENQYNTLVETSGIDENGANALMETNRTLENISKTLREQLSAANTELERVKRSESEATKKVSTYKAQVASLQKSLQSIASAGGSGFTGSVSVRAINSGYSQSQIITVFGSGSFGITTTAMSLAQKLAATSKVLYIDFDLVSPMADSWFKINPIVNNIPGTLNGSIQNSGLGLFIEHGVNIISQHMNNIIKLVNKTKGGGLHYLSGLYYRPDSYKLATANYEELFSLLGSNFQYIIIDFGRLGSNEIGDQLIKVVSDIAYRNIVVTTANQFEVRNFKSKLTNLNINMDSIAWLFNMCTTTALDTKIKDSISPCRYDMLPRMEQYGTQENFLRTSLTRDRFGLFVDRTVFGR